MGETEEWCKRASANGRRKGHDNKDTYRGAGRLYGQPFAQFPPCKTCVVVIFMRNDSFPGNQKPLLGLSEVEMG